MFLEKPYQQRHHIVWFDEFEPRRLLTEPEPGPSKFPLEALIEKLLGNKCAVRTDSTSSINSTIIAVLSSFIGIL